MTVHNLNGTKDNDCSCGSWLQHWKTYNEKGESLPKYCVEKKCLHAPTVGAHVQKNSGSDRWYIIPLCDACNKKTGDLEIMEGTSFAPANKNETCGKSQAAARGW